MQHVLKSCIAQDGGPKVNSIFEKARAMGATEGSIADLQQPGSSGIVFICRTVRLQQSCGVLASKNCQDTHWMFCYTNKLERFRFVWVTTTPHISAEDLPYN